MHVATLRSLLVTLVAGLVAGAATAGEPSGSEHRQEVRVQKVVVRHGGDEGATTPGQSVMVKSRQVDGAPATTEITVVGEAGDEVFDAGALEPGESRTFTTQGGKEIEVKRLDSGLTLAIDGKEIVLPGDDVLAAAPEALPGGPHEVRVVRWRSSDGGETEEIIGAPGAPGDTAVFVGAPGHGLGLGLDDASLAQLDTVKDLDPEIREKVIAALHEILSKRKIVTVMVTEDAAAPVAVPAPPGTPARKAPIAR